MRKLALGLFLSLVLVAPLCAQEMPAPHRAPRTPVNRVALEHRGTAAAPVSRDIQGQATILDGEKLRVNETDVRLFGIVPPQLSASFGPQARGALDAVVAGQAVNCHIRDRDHDGRLLATCRSSNGTDLALDLLRRGLAVTARGSLSDTEFAQPYLAAEQAAVNQKLGLWSVVVPVAATVASPAAPVEAAKPVVTPPPQAAPEVKAPEAKKEEPKVESVKPVTAPPVTHPAAATTAAATVVAAANDNAASAASVKEPPAADASGFFARYQILIAGCFMLAAVFGVLGTFSFHRVREKRDEMQALAAALRGELLAARAVCLARLRGIVTEDDDRNTVWPRLRSTLYQAYVGRIGWLGAELARQVASIYGQATDYASYYQNAKDEPLTGNLTPKRQALTNLVHYIEEVLPRLSKIEETGIRLKPGVVVAKPTQTPMPAFPQQTSASTENLLEGTRQIEHHVSETATDSSQELAAEKVITENKPASSVSAPAATATVAAAVTETIIDATEVHDETTHEETPPEDHETGTNALWESLRRYARERFSSHSDTPDDDSTMTDYSELIQQDLTKLGLHEETEHEPFGLPEDKRKRGAG